MSNGRGDEEPTMAAASAAPGEEALTEADIYAAASEIEDATALESYLDAVCGGDANLKERIENLLRLDVGREFMMPGPTQERFRDEAMVELSELATETAEEHDEALGTNGFIVGREIARGGMGSVREAEELDLQRRVAVKTMHWDAAARPDVRARFIREARVLAKLAHPNIVPIYDIAWEGDFPLFYSMKLVKGMTLQEILLGLRSGDEEIVAQFSLNRLLSAFRKVCDAIAFAHSRGVIHRDLKPANVMVGEFGEVLVMDWGIAKQVGEEEVDVLTDSRGIELGMTMEGEVLGTPQYMSPEQARGEIERLDERSDIFSLGGILYAILTLRPPVEGKSVDEVLEKITSGAIESPEVVATSARRTTGEKQGDILEAKEWNPLHHCPSGRVPSALSSVVMSALSLDPEKRYQSVSSLSEDVERYQNGFATSVEQAGLGTQVRLLVMRNKGTFATSFIALLTLIGFSAWFVVNLQKSERNARMAEAEAIAEKEATSRALSRAQINLADAALREEDGPAMRRALSVVPGEFRDSTWEYLWRESDTSIFERSPETRLFGGVSAHPLLPSVFAIADMSPRIQMVNVSTGETLLEFDAEFSNRMEGIPKVAFSPDGNRIAVGRRGADRRGIVIHDSSDGRKLLEWDSEPTEELEYSPDGNLLLQEIEVSGSGWSFGIFETETGRLLWSKEKTIKDFWVRSAFSAEGREVLVTHGTRVLRFDSVTGEERGELEIRLPSPQTVSLQVDRDLHFASMDFSGRTYLYDLRRRLGIFEIETFGQRDSQEAFLRLFPRNGMLVTVAGLEDGRQSIQVWRTDRERRIRTILGGVGKMRDVAIHPISGELMTVGGMARAWDLFVPKGKRFQTQNGDNSASLAFFGSDTHVFSAHPNATMALRSVEDPSSPDEPLGMWPVARWRQHVSRSGEYAAVYSGEPVEEGKERQDDLRKIRFLRNTGTDVEEIGSFPAQIRRGGRDLPRGCRFLRLSPDARKLAACLQDANDDYLRLVDPKSGNELVPVEAEGFRRFRDFDWIDDDRLVGLVTQGEERGSANSQELVVLWDMATGRILEKRKHTSPVDALAVEPGGERFAEAGVDKVVRIRDATTLEVIDEFRAHNAAVVSIEWHPGAPILATGGKDHLVRLWNVSTHELVAESCGWITAPTGLDFSPSGNRLGISTSAGTTSIWELPDEALQAIRSMGSAEE